mmetsp:Transcript_54314/g.153876  ORF Transcript_54314/g.153876 Transcript_54314/m.153876 type:complete len:260 (-) Transcript_54314:27-806(-)
MGEEVLQRPGHEEEAPVRDTRAWPQDVRQGLQAHGHQDSQARGEDRARGQVAAQQDHARQPQDHRRPLGRAGVAQRRGVAVCHHHHLPEGVAGEELVRNLCRHGVRSQAQIPRVPARARRRKAPDVHEGAAQHVPERVRELPHDLRGHGGREKKRERAGVVPRDEEEEGEDAGQRDVHWPLVPQESARGEGHRPSGARPRRHPGEAAGGAHDRVRLRAAPGHRLHSGPDPERQGFNVQVLRAIGGLEAPVGTIWERRLL